VKGFKDGQINREEDGKKLGKDMVLPLQRNHVTEIFVNRSDK